MHSIVNFSKKYFKHYHPHPPPSSTTITPIVKISMKIYVTHAYHSAFAINDICLATTMRNVAELQNTKTRKKSIRNLYQFATNNLFHKY